MKIKSDFPKGLLTFLIITFTAFSAEPTISIGKATGQQVSPLLTGMNLVYTRDTKDMWQDGKKMAALKDAGITCLRYPGGHVVSFWDWEFPYHEPYQNFWDPAYQKSLTPAKKAELKKRHMKRLLLDDYFKICEAGNFEPVVGVNMFQGYKFKRLEDSVAKAVRLVDYCKKQKIKVTYYYLDNEAGHQPAKNNHIPVDDYIKLIPAYARAIKKAQPDAKIIVNTINLKGIKKLITETGDDIDMIDYHSYYNNGSWGQFKLASWRQDNRHGQLENKLNQFKRLTKAGDHKHLKIGLLEWNLGPATGADGSDKGNEFYQGLIQADLLMAFVKENIDMAACWPLTWSLPDKPGNFRDFIDPAGNVSTSKHIFQWFSRMAGGSLHVSSNFPAKGIVTSAVKSPDGSHIFLTILSKFEKSQDIVIDPGLNIESAVAKSFREAKINGKADFVDQTVRREKQKLFLELPGTSVLFLLIKTQ